MESIEKVMNLAKAGLVLIEKKKKCQFGYCIDVINDEIIVKKFAVSKGENELEEELTINPEKKKVYLRYDISYDLIWESESFDIEELPVRTKELVNQLIENVESCRDKRIHIFFHDDPDGWVSGFLVKYFESEMNKDCEISFSPINYDYNIEKLLDKLGFCIGKVYIVDFCLKSTLHFKKVAERCKKIIWIDHHKTSIELRNGVEKGFFDKLKEKGKLEEYLSVDEGAGCLLVWRYFNGDKTPPYFVKLVSDYDTWNWKKEENWFAVYLAQYFHLNKDSARRLENRFFKLLIDHDGLLKALIEGKRAYDYELEKNIRTLEEDGFETTIRFEDKEFSAYAVNKRMNSIPFEICEKSKDKDIYCTFYFRNGVWTVSLYTNKDIDVSKIAKKYGGGGHKQASGFQCDCDTLKKFLLKV